MAIPSQLKRYIYHVLIGADQFFNALTGGAADETLSSRTYRGAMLAKQPKKRWCVLYRLINSLFFDASHCKTAYESELKGRQHDKRFTEIRKKAAK